MESPHVLGPNQEHENVESNGDLPMNPGEYNETRMILNDPLHQSMTTSVSFDTHEQLFWAGTLSVSFGSLFIILPISFLRFQLFFFVLFHSFLVFSF